MLERDHRLVDHEGRACAPPSKPRIERPVRTGAGGKRPLSGRDPIARERPGAGVKELRSTPCHPGARRLQTRRYDCEIRLGGSGDERLRPTHHRAARRIRARVMVCTLALLCLRHIELRTKRPWDGMAEFFGRLRATGIERGDARCRQRPE